MKSIQQNNVGEWTFTSNKKHADPFNEVELTVCFQQEGGGAVQRVPAFWAGGREWRVRFASPRTGAFRFRTECSNTADTGLHAQEGRFKVVPYKGKNPLLRHGPVQVAADRRHFAHADGTPFFWLGDTWWMGLCRRWRWPQDFRRMAQDRHRKGFSVVQIVSGLYPDMAAFDPRGANEAGYPWEKDWSRIRPAYFDKADLRIRHLIDQGIAPCLVGAWGYYLPLLGLEQMKRHWRYLVARWGAYPVFWCLAGEAVMPYYLSKDPEGDKRRQKEGWTAVARYIREIDAFRHPITLHTAYLQDSRFQVDDPALVDFSLVQGGGVGFHALGATVKALDEAWRLEPVIPIVQGESCYENNMSDNGPAMQRFLFWSVMLSGCAGHTYGADGIWQINSARSPYGPSPHGCAWGDTPWEEAMRAPGGAQTACSAAVLRRLPWQGMAPHQEWVEPAATVDQWNNPYAAGIPGKLRVIYFPILHLVPWSSPARVKGLESGIRYRARFVDPRNGIEYPACDVCPDAEGAWRVPLPVTMHDWVLVLTAKGVTL